MHDSPEPRRPEIAVTFMVRCGRQWFGVGNVVEKPQMRGSCEALELW